MADLSVLQIGLEGTEIDPGALATIGATNTFLNNGRTVLYVIEDSVSATATLTFESLVDCEQGHTHDIVVTVEQETKIIGPFPPNRFNNDAGKVTFTGATIDDVTVKPISI